MNTQITIGGGGGDRLERMDERRVCLESVSNTACINMSYGE